MQNTSRSKTAHENFSKLMDSTKILQPNRINIDPTFHNLAPKPQRFADLINYPTEIPSNKQKENLYLNRIIDPNLKLKLSYDSLNPIEYHSHNEFSDPFRNSSNVLLLEQTRLLDMKFKPIAVNFLLIIRL
jgi:hypothetical protein